MLNIVIDARWIFPRISGIGRYTRELIKALAEEDQENHYMLLFDRQDVMQQVLEETGAYHAPRFVMRRLPYGLFSAWNQVGLPVWLRRIGAHVYHSPNYMLPFLAFPRGHKGRIRCVSTIHDLIPLLFPEYTPRALKTRLLPLFRAVMRESALRSDLIVVPSRSTQMDVQKHLHIPEERIRAIPEGVGQEYVPPAGGRSGDARTILYVGRFDPYKNVPVLVEAYARLRQRGLSDVKLRVIGEEDPRYPEARWTARKLGVESFIQWEGYISGSDLIRAYQQADVFCLPSRYEGFGLPILEAMASGTPVVCGKVSSPPEVAGDAALLVAPDDAEELTNALYRIFTDDELAGDLSRRGIAQAARFTWRRAARETIDAYRAAAQD